MIERLPFECQIEVLQHLPANSIEIVKTILPSWSQSCSDVSLWRRILDESLKTSPILDSNYADKLDKVNRNDQSREIVSKQSKVGSGFCQKCE